MDGLYSCYMYMHPQLVCTLTKDELALAEQIMNNLLGRQVDSNYIVRMYCIRGLGNMADIGGSQVSSESHSQATKSVWELGIGRKKALLLIRGRA